MKGYKNCETQKRVDVVCTRRLERYFSLTEQAIKKLRIATPEKTLLYDAAREFLRMASAYLEDARHFKESGHYVNAFAAVNYAHGWLDAGARLGLFDVGHDSRLFSVDGFD